MDKIDNRQSLELRTKGGDGSLQWFWGGKKEKRTIFSF